MKNCTELSAREIQILRAVYYANDQSVTTHNALGLIKKFIPREIRNEKHSRSKINNTISKLNSNGFLRKGPTRGDTTYYTTKKGIDCVK